MTLKSDSGQAVSRFSFGTMQFGGKADAKASAEMYAAARGAGLNFFDTAYVYTGGESERILGPLIAAERSDVVVATKAAYDQPSTPENLTASLETSLSRMDTDYVDVLYLHRFDDTTPLEVTFDGLAALMATGKARAIGVSNFAAWQVVKADGLARERGIKIDIIQPMYNLVKRQAEVEILPMCADQGVACAPYSPLGGGLLTGKYAAGNAGRLAEDKGYEKRYGPDWMHQAASDLSTLAQEVGVSPATLAVAWAAAHPAGPTPIVSARSAEQLQPSLAAIDYTLSPELYAQMAALTPTPPPATDRLEEQE